MADEAVVETPEGQPEAAQEPAAPAPESTPEQESEVKEAAKTFTQDELNEILEKRLAKERRKLQREASLEAENTILKAQLKQSEPPPQKQPDGRPTPDGFSTYEEYLDALTDWKLDTRQKASAQEAQEREQKERKETEQKRWIENSAKARETHADFDEVIDSDLQISKPMMESILDSDIGPEIAYFLGKNPAEAQRIAGLSPVAAIREIGKIEASLSTTAKPSNAPPPIKPIGSKGSSAGTDLSKMSMEEYLATRKKAGASWSRWR